MLLLRGLRVGMGRGSDGFVVVGQVESGHEPLEECSVAADFSEQRMSSQLPGAADGGERWEAAYFLLEPVELVGGGQA